VLGTEMDILDCGEKPCGCSSSSRFLWWATSSTVNTRHEARGGGMRDATSRRKHLEHPTSSVDSGDILPWFPFDVAFTSHADTGPLR
jgi:hypothetical protein